MKLILENWKKFLKESTLSDYEPDKLGPLSVWVESASDYAQIVLYHMFGENKIYIVGAISLNETMEPCIPKTFEVGTVYVEPQARDRGFGKLLYDLAFYVAKKTGVGLTSDHSSGTTDVAKDKAWKKINVSDKYNKRQTEMGNDEFDYNNSTPDDPNDDCDDGQYGNPASDYSLEMTNTSEIASKHNELAKNHQNNIKNLTNGKDQNWLENELENRSSSRFYEIYSGQAE